MVAVKRKRTDTAQRPSKKLHKAVEDENDEIESDFAVSEGKQGEPNTANREQEDIVHSSNKLPTASELRAINEAANLYRNNAFKAQLDLLLPNVRAKNTHAAALERLLERLYGHITSIPSVSPVHPLEVTEVLFSFATLKSDRNKDKQKNKEKEKGRNVIGNNVVNVTVPYPNPLPTQSTAWKVGFEAPAPKGIIVVGSWQDSMAVLRPDGAPFGVDLMVEMPENLFQEKDYRNARVFHKRAFYLACIAASLTSSADFGDTLDIRYESPEGDERKTVLVLTPKADDILHPPICIRIILTIPDAAPIPLNRLSPSQANLRLTSDSSDVPLTPSPTYNSTVALTLSRAARTRLFNTHKLLNEMPSFRDALALLRVWANQRGYGAGSQSNIDGKSKHPMAEYCVRGFEGLGAWWGCVIEVLVSGEEVQDEKAKRSNAGRPLVGRGLSSYQLFRAALDFLSKRDFVKEPVFMKVSPNGMKFNISEWTATSQLAMSATSFKLDEAYAVPIPVFVDSTGCMNMLGGVPAEALELLRLDAFSTLSLLNRSQSQDDAFDKIFLHDAREPSARFDAVIKINLSHLHIPPQSQTSFDLPNLQTQKLITLLHTLRRALNTRIKAIVALQPHSLTRPVSEAHPEYQTSVTIGLIYDETAARRLVDLGPAIQEEEETLQQPNQQPRPTYAHPQTNLDIISNPFPTLNAFQSFWGPKSELRRFKDGRILESCVWDEGIVRAEDREGIVPRIVRYILGYRFRKGEGEVGTMKVVGGDLGEVVVVREERRQGSFKDALGKFETLVRAIKALEDEEDTNGGGGKYLPLSVVSCRPGESAAGLRYMDVVPPAAVSGITGDELESTADPFGVVLQLERSGMWPNDFRAIQKVKMALLESMARGLKGMNARVGKENIKIIADIVIEGSGSVGDSAALEVTLDGWSFRVRIAHDREVLLLEEVIKPSKQVQVLKQQQVNIAQDITLTQAQQALIAYQTRFYHAPAHHAAFLALHHRIPAFAYTVRLVKRWFGAHWLSGRVREEAVELICAAVLLTERREGASGIATGKRGFINVLEWLSRWQGVAYVGVYEAAQEEGAEGTQPGEEGGNIEVKAGPGKGSWRLATKEDKEGTVWCGDVGPVIATRVQDLARASVEVVRSSFLGSFKPLFDHPKEDYDFLIELDKKVVTRYWQSLPASKAAPSPTTKPVYMNLINHPTAAGGDIPTRVGFNPIETYFRDLQRIYGDVAELFYDIYGGTVIGGVWNPLVAGKEHTWRVMLGFSSVYVAGKSEKGVKSKGKGNANVRFNKDGVLAEMKRMGEGIIVKIIEV